MEVSTSSTVPRSPPRLAELQSELTEARSAKWARPETISSRKDWRRAAATSRVVEEITRPSGSFHDALRLEPSCFIKMCEALTSSILDWIRWYRSLSPSPSIKTFYRIWYDYWMRRLNVSCLLPYFNCPFVKHNIHIKIF